MSPAQQQANTPMCQARHQLTVHNAHAAPNHAPGHACHAPTMQVQHAHQDGTCHSAAHVLQHSRPLQQQDSVVLAAGLHLHISVALLGG
jgi:hypothetical protein